MSARSHSSSEEKVPVFEGETLEEVEKIKTLLLNSKIHAEIEKSAMVFPNIPTEQTFKVYVKLKDEPQAFEVIDQYFKESGEKFEF